MNLLTVVKHFLCISEQPPEWPNHVCGEEPWPMTVLSAWRNDTNKNGKGICHATTNNNTETKKQKKKREEKKEKI